MKKMISLMLVLMLACASFVACGGGEKEEAAPEATTQPASTSEQGAKPSQTPQPKEETPSEDLTWEDMPIYPGAEIDEGMFAGGVQKAEEMEWRYYKTKDSFDKVVDFYKSEMPKNGWHEDRWMDVEMTRATWTSEAGKYSKNDGQDVASADITYKGEEVTFIVLMRASY